MQTDSRVNNLLPSFFVDRNRKGFSSATRQQRYAIVQLAYTWHTGNEAWASTWPIRGGLEPIILKTFPIVLF